MSNLILQITKIIKDNLLTLSIDIMWLLSMCLEINGGRAKSNTATEKFNVIETFNLFWGSFKGFSIIWKTTLICLFCIGILMCFWGGVDEKYRKNFVVCLLSGVFTTIYLVLLCTKVSSSYIGSTQVVWGMLFYFQLMAVIVLAKMVKMKNVKIKPILAIVLVTFTILVCSRVPDYAESNALAVSPQVAKAIDEDIIEQAVTSYSAGKTEVTIKVPYCGTEDTDGFPFAVTYGGERISKTLYRHGLVDVRMNITLERDYAKNEEFGLD